MATRFKLWFYLNLTKNTDPEKYSHDGYGIGFNTRT